MIAEVILEVSLGKTLDYLIPQELESSLSVGCWVTVPLRGRSVGGYVTNIKAYSDYPSLRPILEIKGQGACIPPELFTLALWIAKYYHTPIERTIKTMLPTGVRKGVECKTQQLVARAQSKEALVQACKELLQKAPQQSKVLEHMLKVKKSLFLTELMEQTGASRESIRTLVEKGFIKLERVRSDRSLLQGEEYFHTRPKQLRSEQQKALDTITQSIDSGLFSVKLLHGITGSGKTEVYLQAIQHALRQGKTALMLVPEIALTTQTILHLKSRFSQPIAILHHRLTDGERQTAWKSIKEGQSPIVIGARSAIFSPLPSLGVIIIDEEHEGSYKQTDDSPSYHARDVAVMRGKIAHATVVLGSATPSLESIYNAQKKKYELLTLTERGPSVQLPTVHIVDMTREYEQAKCRTPFSKLLLQKMEDRFKKGEQTILFLNRRGYYTTCLCSACSKTIQCTSCDTTMTFHKKLNTLTCHLCGKEMAPPRSCPSCKAENMIHYKGLGTEKVEAIMHALFPDMRILRADADTTRHKGSLEKILHHFRSGKADLLIGTQMIAKGLHFPEVTLVGVINCDSALQIPDFRAQEMTFQLIVQVAGRAGRGMEKGEVILQTTLPSHTIVQAAARQDFQTFQHEELTLRKMFDFPPYTHIVKVICSSTDEKKAKEVLTEWTSALQQLLPSNYICHPPTEAGHAKIKDVFRFQCLIRGPSAQVITNTIESLESSFSIPASVQRFIDVDPLSTFF